MPDPVYTSIDIVPIDSKANGVCSLCGAMVLDYSTHTLFHRGLVQAFQANARANMGIPPLVPRHSPFTTKEIEHG